jgi:hypothetical protein
LFFNRYSLDLEDLFDRDEVSQIASEWRNSQEVNWNVRILIKLDLGGGTHVQFDSAQS